MSAKVERGFFLGLKLHTWCEMISHIYSEAKMG